MALEVEVELVSCSMGRIAEFWAGYRARNSVLFTGQRRRLTSLEVRGVQMAEELGGYCMRSRFLRDASVQSSQALFWITEADLALVERFDQRTPQVFEPINPKIDPAGEFNRMCRAFKYLWLNTESCIHWLGLPPEAGWKHWVVPHHHCNGDGYDLPEERLANPKVVGYIGEPEHLHDTEAIQSAVEKLGLRFLSADSYQLDQYKQIDIGIAWTRREELRDQTRSNIKLANLCAHGIPSVVCNYESYRSVNEALGGSSCLIRDHIQGFIEGIAQLATDKDLRRQCHAQSQAAKTLYARSEIAKSYTTAIAEMNANFAVDSNK